MKKTKIIVTLGPSSSSEQGIIGLIKSGMDVARINLSHGDRENHFRLIKNVRSARKKVGCNIAILLDTRGPEIRVDELMAPMVLVEGKEIVVRSVSP